MIESSTKMNACRPPVIRPRNIIGSGTMNGMMLPRITMTSSSPKMLPKRRSESDSSRDEWLMTSITSISGAIQPGIVADQDEQAERGDERQVLRALGADPFPEQVGNREDAVFEQHLKLAGM